MNLIDIVPPSKFRPVLVVAVPIHDVGQLMDLRDFVRESLDHGVVVLPDDCTWGLEAMPEELGVRMMSPEYYSAVDEMFEDTTPISTAPSPEPEPEPGESKEPTGRNAEEKRAIQTRLKAYRDAHGLGCWKAVAKASRGKLSDDKLRDMQMGVANLPIAEWRLAAKALDKLEGQE